MILQFHLGKFAVTADINKAFFRIAICPEDRDFCRFLWFDNEQMNSFITYRFKVVLFGATCSPFLLTLEHKPSVSVTHTQMWGVVNPFLGSLKRTLKLKIFLF